MLFICTSNDSEPVCSPPARLNYTQLVVDASDFAKSPIMFPLAKVMFEYDADAPSI